MSADGGGTSMIGGGGRFTEGYRVKPLLLSIFFLLLEFLGMIESKEGIKT